MQIIMSRYSALCLMLAVTVMSPIVIAEYLVTSTNDLLSAFSHATLNFVPHLPDPLIEALALNLTSAQIDALRAADSMPRRKRQIIMKEDMPAKLEVEARYIMPLFNVYEGDNVNFELPFLFEMDWPELVDKAEIGKKAREWSEAVGAMASDMEGIVSMLGVDGGGCVRRALCELATMPPLQPQGLIGEMLHIITRRLTNDTYLSDFILNTFLHENVENDFNVTEKIDEDEGEEVEGIEEEVEEKEEEEESIKDEEKEVIRGKNEEKKEKSGKKKNRKPRQKRDKLNYIEATDYGKKNGDCWEAFPECPFSLIDLLGSLSF